MSAACPRCEEGGRRQVREHPQVVRGVFDVERAWLLVESVPREAQELPADQVDVLLTGAPLDPAHVEHVDASQPGMLARIAWADFAGEWHQAEILIDGHHRAARCRREGRPFRVFRLTLPETRLCLTAPRWRTLQLAWAD